MAQAARLNLRMQKELKLLITDPPPGVAFPSLSSETSSSSATCLSSIDAQIEGPEGSVYEKGVFKLKIQIPERYPFQPPIVTFVTPIYHPNIDTGGRICLDILNLPPKGAWQPSLNISTVLTSIGLLLNEPNPDDGLMHEASREYKYNRQLFNQKARSMTEKFAEVGASKIENVVQGSQILPNTIIESVEAKQSDTSMTSVQDHFVSHKRLCGVTRKLSLESSESDQRRNDVKVINKVPTSHLYDRRAEVMGLEQESRETIFDHNKTYKDLEGTKKKLSLELLVPVLKKSDDNMINVMSTSSLSQPQILLMDPSRSCPLARPCFSSQPNPHVDEDNQATCFTTETRLKSDSRKSCLKTRSWEDDKKLSFALQQTVVQFSSSGSHQIPSLAQTISHQNEREPHKHVVDRQGSCLSWIKRKKLGLSGRRLYREQLGWNHCPQKDNKENLAPNSSLHISYVKNSKSSSLGSETGDFYSSLQTSTNSSHDLSGTEQRKTSSSLVECNDMKTVEAQLEMQSEYPWRPQNMQNDSCDDKQQPKEDGPRFDAGLEKQEVAFPSADAVIVLDSEDSEEEQTTRSKLSLARRRLQGKRKREDINFKSQ